MLLEDDMGLYTCGFPSGSTGAASQEIVLESILEDIGLLGFAWKKNEVAGDRKWTGERDIRGDVSARTKNKKDMEGGKAKCTRQGPEIPGHSTLTPGIYLDLKRPDFVDMYMTRLIDSSGL